MARGLPRQWERGSGAWSATYSRRKRRRSSGLAQRHQVPDNKGLFKSIREWVPAGAGLCKAKGHMKKGSFLFVYGSLRSGEASDLSLQSGSRLVGPDRINGKLYEVGWYPGVKTPESNDYDPRGPLVSGEVYELLDDGLIRHLDSYEGYPNLFNRHQVETERSRFVWVYTYNGTVGENQLVASGDWLLERNAA
jgi:gamma-glutamylcyclotransferase (GGCT)/AIG2-like uncharacterized protein YtfP